MCSIATINTIPFLVLLFVLLSPNIIIIVTSVSEPMSIRVAILLTGRRPTSRVERFGSAATDLCRFLTSTGQFTISHIDEFPCYSGKLPSVDELNGYDLVVVPGSSRSVNSGEPWAMKLEQLVTNPKRQPWVVGFCYGHELICKAYGGRVERHPNGWELGACDVKILKDVLAPSNNRNNDGNNSNNDYRILRVLQSHREHVTDVPRELQVWAVNEHSPIQGVLSRKLRVFTTQFHPEYTKEYLAELEAGRDLSPADQAKVNTMWDVDVDTAAILDIMRQILDADES